MARVQQEAAKAPPVATQIIRPRQAILVVMLLACGAMVALVVAGALRSGEVLVA